jgi:anaerobic magnesium-protoporphyrin IX monomethyl ester cyclase
VEKIRLPHTRGNPTLSIMTSRGCPHHCIFCSTSVVMRRKARFYSIERVVDEMEYLVRCGAREIHFWDDNLVYDTRRTAELCEGILKRNLGRIPLASVSGVRPDIGDVELFRLMRRAGFYFLCMAFETGDQEVMRKLGKPTDLSKAKSTAMAARRAGITVNGFFMIGLPFDTEETMNRTVEFACSLPIDLALFFITIPFPGTRLYDMVVERGRFVYHRDDGMWEKGFFLGRATYDMPGQFDAATVERIYRTATRRFFLRPGQILRLLRVRIRRPADLLHAIRKGWHVLTYGRQFR